MTGPFAPTDPLAHNRVVEEVVVDCVACAEPFALEVDTEAEEQSHFVSCPTCNQALEVFARCRPGEVLSISVSRD